MNVIDWLEYCMYIYIYKSIENRDSQRIFHKIERKKPKKRANFSNDFLEGREGTKTRKGNVNEEYSLSLSLKEGSLNVIIDRNSLRHANSISRDFEQLVAPPTVSYSFHHLALDNFGEIARRTDAIEWNDELKKEERKRGREGKKKEESTIRNEGGTKRGRMEKFPVVDERMTNYSSLITKPSPS